MRLRTEFFDQLLFEVAEDEIHDPAGCVDDALEVLASALTQATGVDTAVAHDNLRRCFLHAVPGASGDDIRDLEALERAISSPRPTPKDARVVLGAVNALLDTLGSRYHIDDSIDTAVIEDGDFVSEEEGQDDEEQASAAFAGIGAEDKFATAQSWSPDFQELADQARNPHPSMRRDAVVFAAVKMEAFMRSKGLHEFRAGGPSIASTYLRAAGALGVREPPSLVVPARVRNAIAHEGYVPNPTEASAAVGGFARATEILRAAVDKAALTGTLTSAQEDLREWRSQATESRAPPKTRRRSGAHDASRFHTGPYDIGGLDGSRQPRPPREPRKPEPPPPRYYWYRGGGMVERPVPLQDVVQLVLEKPDLPHVVRAPESMAWVDARDEWILRYHVGLSPRGRDILDEHERRRRLAVDPTTRTPPARTIPDPPPTPLQQATKAGRTDSPSTTPPAPPRRERLHAARSPSPGGSVSGGALLGCVAPFAALIVAAVALHFINDAVARYERKRFLATRGPAQSAQSGGGVQGAPQDARTARSTHVPTGPTVTTPSIPATSVPLTSVVTSPPMVATAVAVEPMRFQAISSWSGQLCGVTHGGELVCWPAVDGTAADTGLKTACVGQIHVCALGSDGAVTCSGIQGIGRHTKRDGHFTALACGSTEVCGLGADRRLSCWHPFTRAEISVPSADFLGVGGGSSGFCGLRDDGAIECWKATGSRWTSSEQGFYQVAVGRGGWCGRRRDGEIVCWSSAGKAARGPKKGTRMNWIRGGAGGFCGRTVRGEVECWGGIRAPQGTRGVVNDLAVGDDFVCALTGSGSVECSNPAHEPRAVNSAP